MVKWKRPKIILAGFQKGKSELKRTLLKCLSGEKAEIKEKEAKTAAAAKAAREKEIAEAQARRREFYREKGEKTAKRRKLLLNIA